MPGIGMGWGTAVGVGEQTGGTLGTAAPSYQIWVPTTAETLKNKRKQEATGAPYASRMDQALYRGIQENDGNIQLEALPQSLGWLLKAWNGQVTSVALPGTITVAPTLAASTGSGPVAGGYRYKVAAVLSRTLDARKIETNASPSSNQLTTSGADLTITVTITPVTPPTGFTLAGYKIYRTAAGGAAGTEVYRDYQAGAGSTYADNAATALQTAIIPQVDMYEHTFTPAAVATTNPLRPYTIIVNKNNANAIRFIDARCGKMSLQTGSDPSKAIKMIFDWMALSATKQSEGSPTYTVEGACMPWQTRFGIDSTLLTQFEGMNLAVDNGLEMLPGMSGSDQFRDVVPANVRKFTGDFSMGFENFTYWDKMLAFTTFAILAYLDADDSTPATNITTPAVVSSWPKGLQIDIPDCRLTEGAGEQSGASRLVAKCPFTIQKGATAGYDIRMRLFSKDVSFPNQ